jgi:hypothetical protein
MAMPARLVGEAEQVELGAEAAMVAFFGLLQVMQIGLEVLLRGKGRAVDAL